MKQLVIGLLVFSSFWSKGQLSQVQTDGKQGLYTTTAVPFLLIAPDARASALGDAGVSTDPDLFSAHWNAAKLVQIDADYGLGINYVPWLRKIEPGMYLATVNGFKRVGFRSVVAFGVTYFNLGQAIFKDESGYKNGTAYPNEFSLEGSVAEQFGKSFSLGLSLKYIRSDLTNGQLYQGVSLQPGNAVALDFSLFYTKAFASTNPTHFAVGWSVSNVGPKIAYGSQRKIFLPTIMRLGLTYGWVINQVHRTNLSLESSKLLIPTPPIYDGQGNIIGGRDPNRSVLSAMIGSFTDAPGGFSQQLEQISLSPGIEYTYDNTLSLRSGLYLESAGSGNRKLINFGLGLKVGPNIQFDIAYVSSLVSTSSLINTFRLSLGGTF